MSGEPSGKHILDTKTNKHIPENNAPKVLDTTPHDELS